jgi:UDP-3-O-[3-hydroxymyristoyl] glucosamine N-acyltransferase
MKGIAKTVAEVAARIGGQVVGDGSVLLERVAKLEYAGPGELSFLEDAKLVEVARLSHAACLIVPEGAELGPRCAIVAKHPKLAFALAAELLHPPKQRAPEIHPTAVIAGDAQIGAGVFIGAYVCVGEKSSIGDGTHLRAGVKVGDQVTVGQNCLLHPNVFLYDGVTIGNYVTLHAGAVVGADGFGYVRGPAGYQKFPQIGTVIIEDDVEIGANTCIDRGSLGTTRIGRGTKIDNLVQIAHNVEIGERVVIASQTGISGSTVIEDDAVIGGQVGMGDHARVQSGAVIGSKAGVLPGKIVRAGVWWGVPVVPLEEYKRRNAHVGRLPETRAELKELRRQLEELKLRLDDEGA